ncbi:MAG: hypothetical protein IJA97_05750 [Clostridia bacterium]|nr:hypothetical protein [Clostridia bacterium]
MDSTDEKIFLKKDKKTKPNENEPIVTVKGVTCNDGLDDVSGRHKDKISPKAQIKKGRILVAKVGLVICENNGQETIKPNRSRYKKVRMCSRAGKIGRREIDIFARRRRAKRRKEKIIFSKDNISKMKKAN